MCPLGCATSALSTLWPRICFHTNKGTEAYGNTHGFNSTASHMPKIGAKETDEPNDRCQLDLAMAHRFHSTENYGLMLSVQKKKSYHMRTFSTNQQYIQTLHRLELQTTILIEDARVDTDARLQRHTIWKNGWNRLSETRHDQHTDGDLPSFSLAFFR